MKNFIIIVLVGILFGFFSGVFAKKYIDNNSKKQYVVIEQDVSKSKVHDLYYIKTTVVIRDKHKRLVSIEYNKGIICEKSRIKCKKVKEYYHAYIVYSRVQFELHQKQNKDWGECNK